MMQDSKEEKKSGIRYGIQIMCAGYLAYLAIGMLKDGVIGGAVRSGVRPLYFVASLAFLAFAAVTFFVAIRDMLKMKKEAAKEITVEEAGTDSDLSAKNTHKSPEE